MCVFVHLQLHCVFLRVRAPYEFSRAVRERYDFRCRSGRGTRRVRRGKSVKNLTCCSRKGYGSALTGSVGCEPELNDNDNGARSAHGVAAAGTSRAGLGGESTLWPRLAFCYALSDRGRGAAVLRRTRLHVISHRVTDSRGRERLNNTPTVRPD